MQRELTVTLPSPHAKQAEFIRSTAKRKVVRAGRRGGKTVGTAILAVEQFLAGHRILYATPTSEQIDRFWVEVRRALQEPLDAGVFYKNEPRHIIELPGTEQRIRAKTAWNADTLRGDYADLLILDEWQLMNEDAWGVVGAPMLMDNDGDAVFIYTPPSLRSRSTSKADDPQHAAKLFKRAKEEQQQAAAEGRDSRWATFHFASRENPHISPDAINAIASDMTALAYRMEIEAEDIDESPGALWTRQSIEDGRVLKAPDCDRVVVAVDPSATSTGDEAGIIGAGRAQNQFYVLEDATIQGSPKTWATRAVTLYYKLKADCIVAEANNGGEMVALTIATIDKAIKVKLVHASRGKQTRAEPVSAIYEAKPEQPTRAHHVGSFPALEDEMCLWIPGDNSPNRMDALVWAGTDLMLGKDSTVRRGNAPKVLVNYRGG